MTTTEEKLDNAIKNNDLTLLREALSKGCKIDNSPKDNAEYYAYSSGPNNKNNTIYKAIEACVGLDFFKTLLDEGANITEDFNDYKYYNNNFRRYEITDTLLHAVCMNENPGTHEKKKNNEEVINFIIENLSPEHSTKILSYKFGILFQALKNTRCSANVIDALIKKEAKVNNEHDGSLDQLFHNRKNQLSRNLSEVDQEMAKIADNILNNGGKIYQDPENMNSHSINRAVDSNRIVGAETMKVLLKHGATISELTIEQALYPKNYREDVAKLLVDNFTPPNPRRFFDNVSSSQHPEIKIIDFVITHIFDPNLLEETHPKKQQMLERLKEIKSENNQKLKAIAQRSNQAIPDGDGKTAQKKKSVIGESIFTSDLVAQIGAYAVDKNFAKITGIENIENNLKTMTDSYDKILSKRYNKKIDNSSGGDVPNNQTIPTSGSSFSEKPNQNTKN